MLFKSLLRVFIILFMYVFHLGNIIGQTMQTDSLLKLISPQNPDSINANIYYELAKQNYASDTKNAILWAQQGATYFKKIESYAKMSSCMNIEAVCLLILDKPDESIKMHYEILKIRENLNDSNLIAETLINIGNIFYKGQDKEQALEFYQRSKQLVLQNNNTNLLARIYNNIANYYKDKYYDHKNIKDKDAAIKYAKIAIQYKEKLKTDKTLENSYLTLARLYFDAREFNYAANYALKGEKIALQNRNDESVATSKLLLSELALTKNNFEEAQNKINELYTYITTNKAFHLLNTNDKNIIVISNKIRNSNANHTNQPSIESQIDNNTLLASREKLREELKIKYESEKKGLDNINLMLKNKIEQNRAEKNKVISIISIIFSLVLIMLVVDLVKKNRSILRSKDSMQAKANQLYNQNSFLKQSETFKTKLFSIISHDLKSPISNLKSIVELSSEVQLSPEQNSFLMKEIKQELDITSNLLNDLLFWSKVQMKTNSIAWSSFNIHTVTVKCFNTLRSNIKVKHLKIINNIPTNTFVWGDEMRTEFIIRNILHNAIKYSEFYQRIEIGIIENNDSWDLYIKDNGVGMGEEHVKRIFYTDKSKISSKGTLNEQGAGIGLLLCYNFAESLNWKLQVESKIRIGTTFHIHINKKNQDIKTSDNASLENTKKQIHKPIHSDI